MATLENALLMMQLSHANEILLCLCVIWLQNSVRARIGRETTRRPSPQLLSLLRIHGQHGNAAYKEGLKQESEQCLTTTVTNSSEITVYNSKTLPMNACK